ncbi:MAG: type II secretion system F family protein [Acidimicrobiales bacterium]
MNGIAATIGALVMPILGVATVRQAVLADVSDREGRGRLAEAVDRAQLSITARGVRQIWTSAAVMVAIGVVVGGQPGLGAGVFGLLTAVSLAVALLPDRRSRAITRSLPEALETTAQALRAGCPLTEALVAGSAAVRPPLTTDLTEVVASIEGGCSPTDALDAWARRRPLPAVRLFGAAVAVSVRGGASIARALDGVAMTLRERQQVEGEVRTLATQTRLSAMILAAAPPAFTLLMAAVDNSTTEFLIGTSVGRLCLAGGAALDLLAGLWMARITRSVA